MGTQLSLPKKEAEPPSQFSAHVNCGQTSGWIIIALGIEVGLCPAYIVLDWDPAPLSKKGTEPSPNFRPISIVAKRLDASRCHSVYGGRPQPRRVCVRWGPSPSQKGGGAPSPILTVEVENFEIGPEVSGTSGPISKISKFLSLISPPFLNRFTSGLHQNYVLFKGYKVSYNPEVWGTSGYS